jgi:uncharacterized membrane protein
VNLEDCRTLFATTGFVLMLVAASPILSTVILSLQSGEPFSELWVLGPTHLAEDYPFNVTMNDEQQIFVGVTNHMGRSAFYLVSVKLRNWTQKAPDATTSTPSPVESLYEFRSVVADGDTWEVPVAFSFLETSRGEDYVAVRKIAIDDAVFNVADSAMWDAERHGFLFQLFFELWLYDLVSQGFQYHNRFVGVWLNMTR